MRESLTRHFVDVSGTMVPEVRFCGSDSGRS
jgi:hypothetical protein